MRSVQDTKCKHCGVCHLVGRVINDAACRLLMEKERPEELHPINQLNFSRFILLTRNRDVHIFFLMLFSFSSKLHFSSLSNSSFDIPNLSSQLLTLSC